MVAARPASREISTVGGNIATGAGGLLCAKYGVVRDAVLGLDVVLADGRLLRLGHRSVKGVTGYDLTALFIGSEGTLGIVVGATLKLRRLVPGEVRTVTATFRTCTPRRPPPPPSPRAASSPRSWSSWMRRASPPCTPLLALPAPRDGVAQLTVQTDGPGRRREAEEVAGVLAAAGGTVPLARDAAEGERLLAIRRSIHPAMARGWARRHRGMYPSPVALPAMFDEIARIEKE